MPGDSSSDPRLSVTLQNGEKVAGAFRGVAQGKMIFESDGKLLGLGLDAGGVMEVRRQAEVLFEGDVRRDEEVVMHARAAVRDPFRDLASYVGRVVDLDVRELDDLKHSLHTASGRLVSADGDEIRLESEKGTTYIQREFHRVDAAALRVEHYSSRNQISSIGAVAGKVPDGAPVELVLAGGKTVPGRFYGVRKDAAGSYVLLETEAAGGTRLRGYRDFVELRTPGYAKGALLSASETIYTLPK